MPTFTVISAVCILIVIESSVRVNSDFGVPPQNVTLKGIYGNKIEVEWLPASQMYIQGYLVHVWSDKNSNSHSYSFTPQTPPRTLVEFIPYATNFITVAAMHHNRRIGPSSPAVSFTAPQIPPQSPQIFQAFKLSPTAIFLKWTRPIQANGILLGYRIQCSEIGYDGLLRNTQTHTVPDPNRLQLKLNSLRTGTLYRIDVAAVNCVGDSERTTLEVVLDPYKSLGVVPTPPAFTYILNYTTALMARSQYCAHHQSSSVSFKSLKRITVNGSTTTNSDSTTDVCLVNSLILWHPNVSEHRPGVEFTVKYRQVDAQFWQVRTEHLTESLLIRNFNACRSYEIIVSSDDGGGYHSDSSMKMTPVLLQSSLPSNTNYLL